MPRKIKKRKPIAAPDEFIALPNRLLDYLKNNWQEWLNAALIAGIVLVLGVLVRYWWQHRQLKVLNQYAQAHQLLVQKQWEKAKKLLKEVKGSHTGVSKWAALDLAYIDEQHHDLKGAIKQYRFFLKKDSHSSIVPYVFEALSCDYLALSNDKSAQKSLNTMVKKWPQHPLAAWAYLHLGLLAEKKDPNKALAMYEKCLQYQNNPFVPDWLDLKIKTLKAGS